MKQVTALGVVQPERPRDGVQHRGTHAGQSAALHLRVVLDADLGQCRNLAAAKTRDPALPDVRQPDVLRRHPGPPTSEELTHLGSVVHPSTLSPASPAWGALSVHVSTGTSSASAAGVRWIQTDNRSLRKTSMTTTQEHHVVTSTRTPHAVVVTKAVL